MGSSELKTLRIVANTGSSTDALARRANEFSKFVGGITRQNYELEGEIAKCREKSLTLIRMTQGESEVHIDGNVSHYSLSLYGLCKEANPTNIFRQCSDAMELRKRLLNVVEAMKAIIRKEHADVVFLSGTYYVPWCLLEAARELSVPVVLCYAGILSKEIVKYPEKVQHVLKQMEQAFYDERIFYIFPSDLTRKVVEDEIFLRKLSLSRVVHNGVPPEFIAIKKERLAETAIAFVGRCSHEKNPEFLIDLSRALHLLGKNYRTSMVTSAVARHPLMQSLKSAGITVLAPLSTPELGRFYSKAGVVISPSRFETYGNVPIEAISIGTPALINENMGVSEVFRKLDLGEFIVDFSDPRSVAEKIDSMLSEKRCVSSEVREKIGETLTWPSVIRTYFEICRGHAEL